MPFFGTPNINCTKKDSFLPVCDVARRRQRIGHRYIHRRQLLYVPMNYEVDDDDEVATRFVRS